MNILEVDHNIRFSSQDELPSKEVLLKMLADEKERLRGNTHYGVPWSVLKKDKDLLERIDQIAQKHRVGEQWITCAVYRNAASMTAYHLFNDAYWARVETEIAELIATHST